MKKKTYINPALRKVTIDRVRFITKSAHDGKKRVLSEIANGGATAPWSELHTPTVIMDIFAAMTEAEFATWLDRLYPVTPTSDVPS